MGTINDPGDVDLFSVTVFAGQQFIFDLEGASVRQGTLANPFLGLLTSGGGLIASNDDGGGTLNAYISYTAAASTTLYLAASASGGTGTGTYRPSATHIVPPSAGDDIIFGTPSADTIDAQAGNDQVQASDGNDFLIGSAGNDTLFGGFGNDTLDGGAGADTLIGGADRDVLTGGVGDDLFRFTSVRDSSSLLGSGPDTISDFAGVGVAGGDRIDVSAIDADITLGASAFVFIGVGTFTAAGELRVVGSGSDTVILGNIDADTSTAKLHIVVQDGAITPGQWSAADFIL